MRNYHRVQSLRLSGRGKTEYPVWSMLAAMGLIYLTPFVAAASYLAFAVCVYRVIRYDMRTFSVDYCALMPVSMIFRTGGGMSMLVYVCLIAAVWEVVRSGIRGDASYVMMLLLFNYLVARMQLSITNFLLCFGQVLLLCVMLPKQDSASAERAVKAFCISLVIASCYALAFRGAWQLRGILGAETPAYQGTSLRRFQGLLRDPNYFMAQLITGIALMIKLGESRRVDSMTFWLLQGAFSIFGILTYSKTFFLLFVVLVLCYVFLQFRDRKYGWGITLVVAGAVLGSYLLFSPKSPFAVVMTRLLSANNISDLTTGRTDMLRLYLAEICRDPVSLFFGQGMAAEALYKDPHNLFVEIAYYTGLTGLALFALFYGSLLSVRSRGIPAGDSQRWSSKYLVLVISLGLFCTLHGMYSYISYAIFYMASLPVLLPKKEKTYD